MFFFKHLVLLAKHRKLTLKKIIFDQKVFSNNSIYLKVKLLLLFK